MTFPNTQGDLVALEYARKKRTHYPDYERDFMYIMAWAASRIQKYQDAHDSATEAIAKWADDPRFYHARSVNTIRWLMDAKYCRVCPLRYSHAIEDAQRAADLLMLQDGIDPYVIANNYNNVAYFSSLSPQTKEYNLKRALDAMEKVNALIPEARWLPEHPEYVHTKANLVLQELRANGTAQKPPSEVVREVDHWIESLEKTIAILNNDVYRETRTELVKLRKQFAVAAAKP
jgi:hypothetical protein